MRCGAQEHLSFLFDSLLRITGFVTTTFSFGFLGHTIPVLLDILNDGLNCGSATISGKRGKQRLNLRYGQTQKGTISSISWWSCLGSREKELGSYWLARSRSWRIKKERSATWNRAGTCQTCRYMRPWDSILRNRWIVMTREISVSCTAWLGNLRSCHRR